MITIFSVLFSFEGWVRRKRGIHQQKGCNQMLWPILIFLLYSVFLQWGWASTNRPLLPQPWRRCFHSGKKLKFSTSHSLVAQLQQIFQKHKIGTLFNTFVGQLFGPNTALKCTLLICFNLKHPDTIFFDTWCYYVLLVVNNSLKRGKYIV